MGGEQIYHATREHNDLKELNISQVLVRNLQVASDRNQFPTFSTEKVEFIGSLINLWVDLPNIRDGKLSQRFSSLPLPFASLCRLGLFSTSVDYFLHTSEKTDIS